MYKSLFRCQNHLLSFALSPLVLLLRMLPLIFLSSLNSLKFLTLDLTSLLDHLGNMPVPLNPSDFRHMRVSF